MTDLARFFTIAEPIWPRFLLAMGLGHLAGAYAFILTTFFFAALSDLHSYGPSALTPGSWSRLGEGILVFPITTGLLGLWAALMMVLLTLLASPIAWAAARWLRTGLAATVALGALAGLLPAFVAFRDAPQFDFFLYASAAAAGAAFGAVIWRLCIRSRAQV